MSMLFTYGTLKQGYQNEPLLADQKFVGKAVLADDKWRLYEIVGNYPFPALVSTDTGYQVYGELYEVSDRCIKVLDRLEGVSHGLYDRILVKVLLPDGRLVEKVVAYRFLQSTKDCQSVGPVWPLRELSRYRFEGHNFRQTEAEVEIEGVALWNNRQEAWVTGVHANEGELRQSCMSKRNKFGARPGQDEAWSPQWFEARQHTTLAEKRLVQIITGGSASPEFETRNDLAEWAADHLTFFGGKSGDKGAWLKVLSEAVPIIHEV